MAKHAKLIFRFRIQGDGRDECLVNQPLSPSADFTISTEGAVSLYSPSLLGQVTLQPGWNQIVDPASYLLAPVTRNYLALIVPGAAPGQTMPNGQTLPPSITIAGATTDGGVGIIPGAPVFFGLPQGPVSIFMYNWGNYPFTYSTWQF